MIRLRDDLFLYVSNLFLCNLQGYDYYNKSVISNDRIHINDLFINIKNVTFNDENVYTRKYVWILIMNFIQFWLLPKIILKNKKLFVRKLAKIETAVLDKNNSQALCYFDGDSSLGTRIFQRVIFCHSESFSFSKCFPNLREEICVE